MRLLALDTATFALSAALVELDRDGEVHHVRTAAHATGKYVHSVLLPGVLLDLLKEEGLALADLDALVVGLGPGSFTGLRTGVATLKGLAYAARIPLLGASSLAAMAFEAAEVVREPGRLLVPTLDARRGQVYLGLYETHGPGAVEALAADQVMDPADLLEGLEASGRRALVFGQGAAAYAALQADGLPEGLPLTPPAVGLARLVAPKVAEFDADAVLSLVPRYIRRSEAEVKREAGTLRIPGLTA